ncbi:OLC1v1020128C1 [Oldenlandia corymbosa var. corymbosa]|uniref:OLC1v1020128C1 n=1 Tax=Oldenlandia corymbosa var. corymbosa TaxID=529605 RepID=A0AAV1EFR8_OLDCO|nr:OLC1v1020128C1 [Oldenlandia corymbosa var. corymbosa]
MTSSSESKEVELDFSPYLKVYKDGTVERIFGSPFVPPSLDDPITNVSSKDITISSQISARIYLPKLTDPNKKLPVLVYYHGGGFCLESAFSFLHHRYLNQIVSKANVVAVSVEYRLSPEHPLPAAFEDSWAALQWVASHSVKGSEINGEKEPWIIDYGDFDQVYVGGDSAGGNIAYNMAVKAGDDNESLVGGVKILGAVLAFPYFCDLETKKESMAYQMWMFVYPSVPGGINNPLINPFADSAPDLSKIGCRKVFLCCAEKDDLRDANLHYVKALKKSGYEGEVELVDVEGEDHCFQAFDPYTDKAQSLISKMASFIRG